MNKILIITLLMFFCVIGIAQGAQTTFNLTDSSIIQDARARDANPTTNFGSATVSVAQDYGGDMDRPYAAYSTSTFFSTCDESLPFTATYWFYNYISDGETGTYETHDVTDAWSEDLLTWNNQPSFNATADGSDSFNMNNVGWYDLDITSTMKRAADSSAPNVSFNLIADGGGGNTYVLLRTREESSNLDQHSKIEITCEEQSTPTANISLVSPLNNTAYALPLDFNLSVTDSSYVTYYWYINGTINQTTTGNTTFNASDGTYYLEASASDGVSFTENVSSLFRIDNTIPFMTINKPSANNSIVDAYFVNTILLSAYCTDDFLYRLNITAYNESGSVLASIENKSTELTEMTANLSLTTAGINPQDINIVYECADRHTKNGIPGIYTYYDTTNGALTFINNKTHQNIITLDFAYDAGSGIQRLTQPVINALSINKLERWGDDRLMFGFEADRPAASSVRMGFRFDDIEGLELVSEREDALFQINRKRWLDFKTSIEYNGHSYDLIEHVLKRENDWVIWYDIDFESMNIPQGARFSLITESIGDLNINTQTYTLQLERSSFASVLVNDFTLPDFSFSSTSFVPIGSFLFNTTLADEEAYLIPAMNLIKTTGTAGDVYLKIDWDTGSETHKMSSLDSLNSYASSGGRPVELVFPDSGLHYVNISIRETTAGTVSVENQDYLLISPSSAYAAINHSNIELDEIVAAATAYPFNSQYNAIHLSGFSLTNNAGTDVLTTANINNSISSPYAIRSIPSGGTSNEVIVFYDNVSDNSSSLNISSSAYPLSLNASILTISSTDDSGNAISALQATGFSSPLAPVALGAGNTTIAHGVLHIRNGTQAFIGSSVSVASSSGAQTIQIGIRVNGTEVEQKQRTLSSTNVYNIFAPHITGVTGDVNISIVITVPSGESVDIYDESLIAFDSSVLNTETGNIAPLISIIDPDDADELAGEEQFTLIASDVNSDAFLINLSLINSSTETIISSQTTNTSFLYNVSPLGAGGYTLKAIAYENESDELLSTSVNITVTILDESIDVHLISPSDGSTVNVSGLPGQITGTVPLVFNTSLDIDCSVSINNQTINVSSLEAIDTTVSYTATNNTVYDWSVFCNDGTFTGQSEDWSFYVLVQPTAPNPFSLLSCPETTAGMLGIGIIMFFAIAMIGIGTVARANIIGAGGSLMMFVSSWYISPCSNAFALIVGGFSIILIAWFFIRKGEAL